MSKLAQKLAEIMGEIDHVEKKGFNKHYGYKYVRAADLANLVRDKLAKKGVAAYTECETLRNYTIPTKGSGDMQAMDVLVKMTLMDSESGECAKFSAIGTGSDLGDKSAYKAITGALKYVLRNAFLVPDEGEITTDPEADPKTDEAVEPAKPAKQYPKHEPTMSGEFKPPQKPGPFMRTGYVADVNPNPKNPKMYFFRVCENLSDAAQKDGFSVSMWANSEHLQAIKNYDGMDSPLGLLLNAVESKGKIYYNLVGLGKVDEISGEPENDRVTDEDIPF